MIEVLLELKLDSFLVNSTGDSAGLSAQMSTRALRFACAKILSARQLFEDKPSTDFEFLGASSKHENKIDSDKEFDEQLAQYLTSHSTVDISKVLIVSGAAGYSINPREAGTGEIGRMFIKALTNQSSLDVVLVLKPGEFDAIWALTTEQKIQRVLATLVCYKLKQAAQEQGETLHVAGILSSSLQMLPND